MADVVLDLPDDLRHELKAPFGDVYTDAVALLEAADEPIVAVGDIVTFHLLEAGHVPAVAIVDARTERSAVASEVQEAIGGFDREVAVTNPPATVTRALLDALLDALDSGATTLIDVDGEEDLAALPAILAVRDAGSVVYGQPGEGMVLVDPTERTSARVRTLVEKLDGEPATVLSLLGVSTE